MKTVVVVVDTSEVDATDVVVVELTVVVVPDRGATVVVVVEVVEDVEEVELLLVLVGVDVMVNEIGEDVADA